MSENKAAVIHGPYDIRVENLPIPKIDENDVLIKMSCVGICGSDVKLYTTGTCGDDIIAEPFIIGHEGAGTVVKVGANVSNVKVGDRVAIEPTQPCRRCEFCKRGKYNLCVKPQYCASKKQPGNLTTYYKHVSDFCHKIPENMSMEEAAAVQPLAIALHACSRAGVKLGSKIAILGAGPIGILCAMVARTMGASKVLMTDVVEARLQAAKDLQVADYTLLTTKNDSDQTIVDSIVDMLGTNPDITIDACGYAVAARVALLVTKTAGVVLVVGIADSVMEVPLPQALLREVDIRGSYRLLNTYPPAIEAVSSGAIDLKKFITHHFKVEETKAAIELAKTGAAMKIIIHLD